MALSYGKRSGHTWAVALVLTAALITMGGWGRSIKVLFINNSDTPVDFDALGHPVIVEPRTARIFEIGLYDGLEKTYEVRDIASKKRYEVKISGPAASARTAGDTLVLEYPLLSVQSGAGILPTQKVRAVNSP